MQSLLYGLFGESPWNSESVQIPYKIVNDSLWAKLTCFPYNNIYIICYHYTAVTPSDNFFVLRMDRTAEASKTKGGGVYFMINKKWCDPRNISTLSRSCLPHLEHLSIICRQFYLSQEFSYINVTAVYIQPWADTGLALSKLHDVLSSYINKNTLTLPLSSRGTLTKPTSVRSCQNCINMYPVQLEDRIHWIIATLSLRMPTQPAHYQLLENRTITPFSSHRNINKGSFRSSLGGESSDMLVLPLRSYATAGSWWRRLGHVPEEFIWRQRVHGCSIKLCQHAKRANYLNSNYKDIFKSETVGGQNNPCCG